jgi:hypothetical protein
MPVHFLSGVLEFLESMEFSFCKYLFISTIKGHIWAFSSQNNFFEKNET